MHPGPKVRNRNYKRRPVRGGTETMAFSLAKPDADFIREQSQLQARSQTAIVEAALHVYRDQLMSALNEVEGEEKAKKSWESRRRNKASLPERETPVQPEAPEPLEELEEVEL